MQSPLTRIPTDARGGDTSHDRSRRQRLFHNYSAPGNSQVRQQPAIGLCSGCSVGVTKVRRPVCAVMVSSSPTMVRKMVLGRRGWLFGDRGGWAATRGGLNTGQSGGRSSSHSCSAAVVVFLEVIRRGW